MLCPHCGASVRDGAPTCPGCGASLGPARRISLEESAWCPSCGALVTRGLDVCPKCGAGLGAAGGTRERDLDLPGFEDEAPASLGADDPDGMARIESAIPAAGEGASSSFYRRERAPRVRRFLLVAVLAVVVVGGAALLITHPWDPDATSISATTPADTSLVGFPGFLEYLTGQDDAASDDEDAASDEETSSSDEEAEVELTPAEQALEAWEALGDLRERVAASEEALASDGTSGDADARSAGYSEAYAIAIELSNLISEMDAIETDDEDLAEDISELDTLGNWLRNRVDALVDAWELSCSVDDASAHADSILGTLAAADAYLGYFDEYYDAWEPQVA